MVKSTFISDIFSYNFRFLPPSPVLLRTGRFYQKFCFRVPKDPEGEEPGSLTAEDLYPANVLVLAAIPEDASIGYGTELNDWVEDGNIESLSGG